MTIIETTALKAIEDLEDNATLSTTELLDLLTTVGDSAFSAALKAYKNVEEAEDEASRMITTALTLVQAGTPPKHPRAWAATSVRNGLVDRIRRAHLERAHLRLEIEKLMQPSVDEKDEVFWDILVDEIQGLTAEERAVLFGIIAGIYSGVLVGMRAQGIYEGSYRSLRRKIGRALLSAGIVEPTERRVEMARADKGSK